MQNKIITMFFSLMLVLTSHGDDVVPAVHAEPTTRPYSVFMMPALHQQHRQMIELLKGFSQKRDYKAMEKLCLEAVELMPKDATWRYNLACAYARLGRPALALDTLEQAVNLGFSNDDCFASDNDLATLRRSERFATLLQTIRFYKKNKTLSPGFQSASPVRDIAYVSDDNTIWNMDTGCFFTAFSFPAAASRKATNDFVRIPGETGDKIRQWQAEGTAAGNFGDLYDNRDRGHSKLPLKMFPEIVPISYAPEAISNNADRFASLFNFSGIPILGNSSTAIISGPEWRSIPRLVQNSMQHILLLQYLGNEMYVYPQHEDYLSEKLGDVYPSRTPYLYIAPGSSWTDLPIMAGIASAMAAMRPETKKALINSRQLAPAMQYLMRSSLKCVTNREDYLTPAAHPVVFNGDNIDSLKLVTLAHEMSTNTLPPFVAFRVVEETQNQLNAFKDFFDFSEGERLFDSPCAVARVFRGMEYTRKIKLDASISIDSSRRPLKFHWFVAQGDKSLIRIKPLDDAAKTVEIEIDYHKPQFDTPYGIKSSRVDIVLIADNGISYSAPAFLTYFFLPNEIRTYSIDHKIISVDYTNAFMNYVDPEISSMKNWRDLYTYGADGVLLGWTRFRKGHEAVAYTSEGRRVVKINPSGKPSETVPCRYTRKLVESLDRTYIELVEE